MSNRELDRFEVRLRLFNRRGMADTRAEALVDLLVISDRDPDERRCCLECSHCTGAAPLAWRCGNHRAAGVGRELGGDLAALLQRCPGFKEAANSASTATTHNRGIYP